MLSRRGSRGDGLADGLGVMVREWARLSACYERLSYYTFSISVAARVFLIPEPFHRAPPAPNTLSSRVARYGILKPSSPMPGPKLRALQRARDARVPAASARAVSRSATSPRSPTAPRACARRRRVRLPSRSPRTDAKPGAATPERCAHNGCVRLGSCTKRQETLVRRAGGSVEAGSGEVGSDGRVTCGGGCCG